MNKNPVQKKLPQEVIEAARASVNRLNTALSERFTSMEGIKIIAWMSDMHLHSESGYEDLSGDYADEIDTHRQFNLAMHEIDALIPPAKRLIFGGDITHNAGCEEFLTFDRLLRKGGWSIPTLPIFGNHDNYDRPIDQDVVQAWQNIRREDWPALSDTDELFSAFSQEGIRYIVIDSLGISEAFSDRQKEWLKSELASTKQPTLVFCHRPFLPVGHFMDYSAFRHMEVWKMIDECPHVLGVFSGHTHYPKLWKYRRKWYGTFPSVACGIGADTGWGGIVLQDDQIASVFYKQLYGETYDLLNGRRNQDGQYVFMEPELFQSSLLINIWHWPWQQDPEKRD